MGGNTSTTESLRAQVHGLLAGSEKQPSAARLVRGLLIAAIAGGAAGAVCSTLPGLTAFQHALTRVAVTSATAVFLIEYALRVWAAPERDPEASGRPWLARWHYQRSFLGFIDFAVILPWLLGWVVALGQDMQQLAMLIAMFKLGRFARPLSLFAAVFRNEGRALFSGLTAMLLLMVLVSGIMFVLERHAQPDAFSSIPAAMWWATVTMATVGYGDIIPATPLGKVFGGLTMLLGIAMFAVPAGILANGFAAEIRKRDFVVTWRTVASVPLFATLDAARIASIAQLLKTQVLPPRQVVVRHGEPADAMYFIMSGEVEVDVQPQPVRLGKGQYFGEIALVRDTVRMATVTTLSECQLLALEVGDFRRLVAQYPELKAAIERVAEERLHQQAPAPPAPGGQG
jgi:voltage-gated potassium channel